MDDEQTAHSAQTKVDGGIEVEDREAAERDFLVASLTRFLGEIEAEVTVRKGRIPRSFFS